MKAKKSLGQNFLKSERALKKIIEAGKLSSSDTVLEIGPGKGALTEKLLDNGVHVIAVEKDDELYESLKEKFEKEIYSGQLELVHADILSFDPSYSVLHTPYYKLIANIPYNITGQIFKKFLSADNQPRVMVLLVQKEVAERIIAKDGKQSILSVSVRAYGTPTLVDKVLRGSFSPMPGVDSAIIKVGGISKKFFKDIDEEAFFRLIKAGFGHKRKKLSSNLSEVFGKDKVLETFRKLSLDENLRAEDASLETWKELAENLGN